MKKNIMCVGRGEFVAFADCPGCGGKIGFEIGCDSILVNNWSKRFVHVPGMLVLKCECSNPNCEHSKIKPIRGGD